LNYRTFYCESHDCDWGISPEQWGIELVPFTDEERFNLEKIIEDARDNGIWAIGTLIYFNSPEEMIAFIFRWLV